jgi:hypothetical protein
MFVQFWNRFEQLDAGLWLHELEQCGFAEVCSARECATLDADAMETRCGMLSEVVALEWIEYL